MTRPCCSAEKHPERIHSTTRNPALLKYKTTDNGKISPNNPPLASRKKIDLPLGCINAPRIRTALTMWLLTFLRPCSYFSDNAVKKL